MRPMSISLRSAAVEATDPLGKALPHRLSLGCPVLLRHRTLEQLVDALMHKHHLPAGLPPLRSH